MLLPFKITLYFCLSFLLLSFEYNDKPLFDHIHQSVIPTLKDSKNIWYNLVDRNVEKSSNPTAGINRKKEAVLDTIHLHKGSWTRNRPEKERSDQSKGDHPSMDSITEQEKEDLEKYFKN